MKIDWQLYEDEFDPADPVGAITITASDGALIHQEGAYIDSWLEALLTGLDAIADGGEGRIDLDDEADPIEFRRRGDLVEIKFGSATLQVDDLRRARDEVRRSAQRLLERLESADSPAAQPLVLLLRELLAEPPRA